MKNKTTIIIVSVLIISILLNLFLVNRNRRISHEANKLAFEYFLQYPKGYRVLEDPGNKKILYYSLELDNSVIYRYNMEQDKDFSFALRYANLANADAIYSQVPDVSPLGGTSDLKLLGFDGNKLVFWDHVAGDTPGPCSDPWIDRVERLYFVVPSEYLGENLKKQKYTPNEDEIEKRKKEEEKCIKDNQ